MCTCGHFLEKLGPAGEGPPCLFKLKTGNRRWFHFEVDARSEELFFIFLGLLGSTAKVYRTGRRRASAAMEAAIFTLVFKKCKNRRCLHNSFHSGRLNWDTNFL